VICELCDEPILVTEGMAPVFPMVAHRECLLRSVMGGIGHLIDHKHFCLVKQDPDAGLTYRESAKLVAVWVELKGDAASMSME
jgi:hypothetical protein